MYADFLRGYFDGGGSIYSYIDKRWKSSFMYYTCFSSASLDFINYIKKMNSILAEVSGGSIRNSNGVYTLAYAKEDSNKLFNFMYYSNEAICLSRKRDKLLKCINENIVFS